jgi:phosphate transport system substrate-binding protein
MKATYSDRSRAKLGRLRVLGVVLPFVLLPACSDQQQSAPPSPTSTPGKVVLKGSNTIGEELAPRLIAEYKKEHPAAAFELESKATGYGLAALLAGDCDIAGASRTPIHEELELAQTRGLDLDDHVIGAYSVAVIVNGASPVGNLTGEQVRDLFTGKIQNWKDLGGTDAAVHLYIRDPISGTYLGFRELAMENKPYASGTKTFTNYAGIAQAVAQDPNGIGYASFDLANGKGVKGVSIAGVAPTAAAVNEGKYPYARTIRLYTAKGKEAAAALDFIKFVESAHGQQIVAQMGFVPHP